MLAVLSTVSFVLRCGLCRLLPSGVSVSHVQPHDRLLSDINLRSIA